MREQFEQAQRERQAIDQKRDREFEQTRLILQEQIREQAETVSRLVKTVSRLIERMDSEIIR